jgi:predicted RNA-binding protein with EMAP domain
MGKTIILTNKERIEELKEEIDRIENMEDWEEEEYNDYLDEATEAQYLIDTYGVSRILKEVDPIAYNMGKGEYWENKKYELEEELKELENDNSNN